VVLRTKKLGSEVLGISRGDGGLKKLAIYHEQDVPNEYSGEIVALFNPNELHFEQHVTYCAKPLAGQGLYAMYDRQVFQSAHPQTLNLSLFFDTYESHQDSLSGRHLVSAALPTNPLISAAPPAGSVTQYTDAVASLARINAELHRPPVCRLQWGKFEIMRGVLTQLSQAFTMFLADGTPVRATLACTFTQQRSDELSLRGHELHSSDVPKIHTVKRGETLHSIAGLEYGDPALWRRIARANGILNPLQIRPGATLEIPKL
jgi:nucleoid-associated protein YgaU